MRATAFAPATVGNIGPGFDVLGMCVDGVGDTVTVELHDGKDVCAVTGRDAANIPSTPETNAAVTCPKGAYSFAEDAPQMVMPLAVMPGERAELRVAAGALHFLVGQLAQLVDF